MNSPTSQVPRPKQIHPVLIRVLGQMTGFQSGVFVSMTPVVDQVLLDLGVDVAALEIEPRARSSKGNGGGIIRNVTLAYRYAYRDDPHSSRGPNNPQITIYNKKPGMWGLTEAGVAQARALAPVAPPPFPRPRTFAEPFLRALGRLSGHTMSPVSRASVQDETLRLAGFDPARLPQGWNEPTPTGHGRMYEALRWLVRSMSTMITTVERGTWSLTDTGLERAARLNGATLPKTPAPKTVKAANATARWFNKHLTPPRGMKESPLMKMMRGALIKNLPVSASAGLIEDHINNFMVRAIRRDALANMLSCGDVPYSKIASYCVNSGRSDVRNMGTEPVTREMLGARTDKERRTGVATPTLDFDYNLVAGNASQRDTDGNMVSTPSDEALPSAALDFDAIWQRVETIVQRRRPEAWTRYANILRMKTEGHSLQEIADQENITAVQAAKMFSTMRKLMKEYGEESFV